MVSKKDNESNFFFFFCTLYIIDIINNNVIIIFIFILFSNYGSKFKDGNQQHNKAHNQIPNKLFAMSQNTNLKKKVHNYGIGKK